MACEVCGKELPAIFFLCSHRCSSRWEQDFGVRPSTFDEVKQQVMALRAKAMVAQREEPKKSGRGRR